MSMKEVLSESIRLLRDEPRLFVPKFASSLVGSVWVIGFLSGRLSFLQASLALPFISMTAVFASLMVAAMVRDDHRVSLTGAFGEAIDSWRKILYATVFFVVMGFVVVLPASIGITWYLFYGNTILLVATVLFSLLLTVGLVFISYFLPITLLENKTFLDGFKDSLNTSRTSSREVTVLTILSFGLLALAFASNDYMEALGYLGFLVGRSISAIVTTYVFVVSPRYYLENSS